MVNIYWTELETELIYWIIKSKVQHVPHQYLHGTILSDEFLLNICWSICGVDIIIIIIIIIFILFFWANYFVEGFLQ